jgi:hypothetical protein
MKHDSFSEIFADIAINAGMFARCVGIACVAAVVIMPVVIFL